MNKKLKENCILYIEQQTLETCGVTVLKKT